ncbi:phage tail tip lysozyme [uncultured Tessaracoccus sp.]|uniref:phage tail tip lysozyme n=1 Tax=uncultured Tessaracoccus sp. TaxID=905023 RepID=UPI00262D38E0|nr:phage tail tip lysozyme [uncultured Tessaracoccus sp.]
MKTNRTRVAAAIVAALAIVASIVSAPGMAQAADNNKVAFDYFVNKGLTKEQAAGVLGNLMQESGSPINPRATQSPGPGRGIAQWSVGERWATLQRFAANQGRDPWSLNLQLDFIWHEFQTTESYAYRHLKGTRTVVDATLSFSSKFERCGTCHNQTRIAYAQRAFNTYAGGAPAPGPRPQPGVAKGSATDFVNLRTTPNFGGRVLTTIPRGVTLNVQCQIRGANVHGTYNSDWWAKVTYNGLTGYASRAYIRIGHDQPGVPSC